jgi:hypothetical protein
VARFGLWVAATALFARLVGLRRWGAWYSSDVGHRLQTEALLRGQLALQRTPHGQRHDWAWGDGCQQVWGLGVGLLRLPFETAARLLGQRGFPDRLVLVMLFAVVAWVMGRALGRAADGPAGVRSEVDRALLATWERTALLAILLFEPAVATLARTRMQVYEETVLCGALWSLLLAGCLIRAIDPALDGADPAGRLRLLVLGAIAGFAPLVRVTLIAGAAAAVLLALVVRRAQLARTVRALAPGLALGAAVLLGTNRLRFGDPFETGQRLNVSLHPLDQYAKAFGYPFQGEPLGRAAAELFSSLFLVGRLNGHAFWATGIHPLQSATVRFREFYCSTFDVLVLMGLIASWTAVLARFIQVRKQRATGISTPVERCFVMAAWSAASFALLFLFYLRMPSMTSRYAVDFAPAVAVGLAAGIDLAFRSVARRKDAARALLGSFQIAALVLALVVLENVRAHIAPTHAATEPVTAEAAVASLPRPPDNPPPVPREYRCGVDPRGASGIPFDGSGWAAGGDCTVGDATMLYLDRPGCVTVELAAAHPGARLSPAELAPVRARLGLFDLVRVSDESGTGGGGESRSLRFCPPPRFAPNPTGIELLYLGFVAPAALAPDAHPFRLLSVSAADRSTGPAQ